MSTSTRPSSSAAKPTEDQKPAPDTEMPAGDATKVTRRWRHKKPHCNASESSSGVVAVITQTTPQGVTSISPSSAAPPATTPQGVTSTNLSSATPPSGSNQGVCQCPRGCFSTAISTATCAMQKGEAYCMNCYASVGADFHLPTGKKYPAGVAPDEQPQCDCPSPCCRQQPTTAADSLGQPTPQQAIASLVQLRSQPPPPGVGAKAAALEQGRLRTWCLVQSPKVYRVNMAHGSWPWRDLLRAMSDSTLREVQETSDGITDFSFRVLSQKSDHNYKRRDSGERHVFELLMENGHAWHLHFHSNGTCDKLRRWVLPNIISERQCSLAATMPHLA
jgi:hypothetical protein